jgi:hypothetical protein
VVVEDHEYMDIMDGIKFQDETLGLLNGRNSGLSGFYNIIRMIVCNGCQIVRK